MAISGKLVINIGEPNESIGSDSLYTAFTKSRDNFTQLFACASPYNNFTGNGVTITQNSTTGNVNIDNAGVTSIIAGTGISINSSNGAVTITNTGGNGNGSSGVTSVGATSSTLAISNSPIVSSGNMVVNLQALSPNPAGTFTYPSVTVDQYGRVTSIANGASVGTVTSVAVTPGTGIQVTGSPVTSSGTINIVNTGVTRLSAGTGISLSGSNGAVTVSTTPVTAVIPTDVNVTGQFFLSGSEDLATGGAASLTVTASYFTTTGASTATLAAGTAGQIKTFMMVADGGDMVITVTNAGWKSSGTGTITFNDIGDGCTLQYINSKWYCIGQNGVTFA
jgi:hypothetical protein